MRLHSYWVSPQLRTPAPPPPPSVRPSVQQKVIHISAETAVLPLPYTAKVSGTMRNKPPMRVASKSAGNLVRSRVANPGWVSSSYLIERLRSTLNLSTTPPEFLTFSL